MKDFALLSIEWASSKSLDFPHQNISLDQIFRRRFKDQSAFQLDPKSGFKSLSNLCICSDLSVFEFRIRLPRTI